MYEICQKYIGYLYSPMVACGGHFVGIELYVFLFVYVLPIFYIYFLGILHKYLFENTL